MEQQKYFVTVAGNIGSGKSSLTGLIAEHFKWLPYYESVSDNPYLKDFYGDMHRWSFNLQIYFLAHRFKIHREITALKYSVIQDRSIYEDVEIFATNLHQLGRMEDRDFDTYKNLFQEMTYYLNPPDLLIYLKANMDTLLKQIKRRGRDFEANIERDYLELLNNSYEKWINNFTTCKLLIIESDELDFVHSKNDLDYILNTVAKDLAIAYPLF